MKSSLTEIGRTAQIRMNIFEGKTLWRLTEEQESPVDVKETLKDKVVGLYFTAKWSPPCQEFMPLLCEVYQQLIERKLPFEIVHISCDKDQVEMKETLQKFRVCWPYLGFADKHTRLEHACTCLSNYLLKLVLIYYNYSNSKAVWQSN